MKLMIANIAKQLLVVKAKTKTEWWTIASINSELMKKSVKSI
jgi:hypothetical protein